MKVICELLWRLQERWWTCYVHSGAAHCGGLCSLKPFVWLQACIHVQLGHLFVLLCAVPHPIISHCAQAVHTRRPNGQSSTSSPPHSRFCQQLSQASAPWCCSQVAQQVQSSSCLLSPQTPTAASVAMWATPSGRSAQGGDREGTEAACVRWMGARGVHQMGLVLSSAVGVSM